LTLYRVTGVIEVAISSARHRPAGRAVAADNGAVRSLSRPSRELDHPRRASSRTSCRAVTTVQSSPNARRRMIAHSRGSRSFASNFR